jgi:hypothetical protein
MTWHSGISILSRTRGDFSDNSFAQGLKDVFRSSP